METSVEVICDRVTRAVFNLNGERYDSCTRISTDVHVGMLIVWENLIIILDWCIIIITFKE